MCVCVCPLLYSILKLQWAEGFACARPGRDDKKAGSKNSQDSWSNGMENKNLGLLFGRYVAKYFSNWKGTLSCCQSGSKKLCCSHKERSTACRPFINAAASDICVCTGLSSGSCAIKPKHARIETHTRTHTHKRNANPARWKLLFADWDAAPSKQEAGRSSPENPGQKKKKKKSFSVTNWRWQQSLEAFLSLFFFFQLHKLTVKNTPSEKKKIQNSSIQMWEGVQRAGPDMAQHGCKKQRRAFKNWQFKPLGH